MCVCVCVCVNGVVCVVFVCVNEAASQEDGDARDEDMDRMMDKEEELTCMEQADE